MEKQTNKQMDEHWSKHYPLGTGRGKNLLATTLQHDESIIIQTPTKDHAVKLLWYVTFVSSCTISTNVNRLLQTFTKIVVKIHLYQL